MPFRLVSSGGSVNDPAVVNMPASGTITPNHIVAATPVGGQQTGGGFVFPVGANATSTQIFGVGLDYAQGASDTFTRVIPFDDSQIWEADCANAVTTAQIGIRHATSASRGYIHNTATDDSNAGEDMAGVFLAFAITGSTSGSGKLLGRFIRTSVPQPQDNSTWV